MYWKRNVGDFFCGVTSIHSSPVPYITNRRLRGESLSNGTSIGMPNRSRRAPSIAANSGCLTFGQTRIAPSARLIDMLRKSDAGLAPTSVPRPSHAPHQPSELLNEK